MDDNPDYWIMADDMEKSLGNYDIVVWEANWNKEKAIHTQIGC